MARSILDCAKWLNDNHAWNLLLYPRVIANYNLYQKEIVEKPEIMRSHPPGVEIELTNKCNLACTHCLRSLGLKPYEQGTLDMDGFKKLLDQFPYVMHLSLNGFGEPLLAPILWDAVEYAHRVRPWCKILIYSNGMHLTEDNIRKALKSRLTELNVSLDGGSVDIYKKVRRGGNLDLISENIKLFLKLRQESGKRFPRLGLNYVMVNDNEGDLPAFIQLAADLGVDYINCVTYATYDWGFRNSRTLDNYRNELAEAKELLDRTGLDGRYFQEWNSEWLKKDRKFGCNFFWGEEFRVSFSGYVTLGCCAPFPETYSYGNLFEQSFSEIWNCDKIRLNRRRANEGQTANSVCEACDKYAREFFDRTTDDTNEVKI